MLILIIHMIVVIILTLGILPYLIAKEYLQQGEELFVLLSLIWPITIIALPIILVIMSVYVYLVDFWKWFLAPKQEIKQDTIIDDTKSNYRSISFNDNVQI